MLFQIFANKHKLCQRGENNVSAFLRVERLYDLEQKSFALNVGELCKTFTVKLSPSHSMGAQRARRRKVRSFK